MRIKIHPTGVRLWLSARDTEGWATRPGAAWPGSALRGRRLYAEWDREGLLDLAVDGKDADVDAHEFNAITSNFLDEKLPCGHPCWFVAVGQFVTTRGANP